MSELKFAAVDLGAESGRVVLGFFDGSRLRLEEIHRFANIPVRAAGAFHWDILRLWNDIQEGLSKIALQHGPQLDGIGVDTWGVDYALLDTNDDLISNPVHYRDTRHKDALEQTCAVLSRNEIFQRTGLATLLFNTLYRLFAQKQADSAQLQIARTLLLTPDLLNFWLSGRKSAEYSIASTTQMLDAINRNWDGELLDRLGIPKQILPEVVMPGTILGTIRADLSERLKLSADTPVIAVGGHDTASAVAAVPFDGRKGAYLSSGTWSLMGMELDQPLINERVAELNFSNEGGVGGKIRFLKNIAGLWLVQECRRTWLRAGREFSYAELTELAANAKPFGTIIEPDDVSFSAPISMPEAIAAYAATHNQSVPQNEGEYVRCCLESLALKYRWTLDRLEELTGHKLEVLHIVGGGTQNRLLSQFTADAIGRPVVCGPVEATAIGNILVQMMAKGTIANLEAARVVVRDSFEVETYQSNAEQTKQWDEAYKKFLQLQ
jgi:rhamnulokinase